MSLLPDYCLKALHKDLDEPQGTFEYRDYGVYGPIVVEYLPTGEKFELEALIAAIEDEDSLFSMKSIRLNSVPRIKGSPVFTVEDTYKSLRESVEKAAIAYYKKADSVMAKKSLIPPYNEEYFLGYKK
jgi:hypothetical protein